MRALCDMRPLLPWLPHSKQQVLWVAIGFTVCATHTLCGPCATSCFEATPYMAKPKLTNILFWTLCMPCAGVCVNLIRFPRLHLCGVGLWEWFIPHAVRTLCETSWGEIALLQNYILFSLNYDHALRCILSEPCATWASLPWSLHWQPKHSSFWVRTIYSRCAMWEQRVLEHNPLEQNPPWNELSCGTKPLERNPVEHTTPSGTQPIEHTPLERTRMECHICLYMHIYIKREI